jgi:UDP-glucuronate decarboxylase
MNLDDGRVVSNFIVQALRNEPITIYGDGSQTRSFCYVSDLISGFIKMMETDDNITGPFNLGNPNENSMLQLAETVIRLTNSNSKITFKELPQDDPKVRQPDITKAKEILKWFPEVKLEDGLNLTIADFAARV